MITLLVYLVIYLIAIGLVIWLLTYLLDAIPLLGPFHREPRRHHGGRRADRGPRVRRDRYQPAPTGQIGRRFASRRP